jgi:polysaccharide chain length determinant protein (PEP-CTERM system associated)
MNDSSQFDLTYLLTAFYKRKGVIIACFLVVSSLAAYLAVSLPNVYRSSTLILITPQKLPSSYINSTVTMSIQERIHAITQEILSRTRLEKIVEEFGLYPSTGQGTTLESRVGNLRKNILIETPRPQLRGVSDSNSFRLSFESKNPERAQQVASRLASMFIEANLKIREQRAQGTTIFIKAEAERLRKSLEKQEEAVNQFRAKYGKELPEQITGNLGVIEQLGVQLQNSLVRLSSLESGKARLQEQLLAMEKIPQGTVPIYEVGGEQNSASLQNINSLKTQLEILLSRYSEHHPDVIRLKRDIQSLESVTPDSESEANDSPSTIARDNKNPSRKSIGQERNPVRQLLLRQIEDLDTEIRLVRSNYEAQRKKTAIYQARVENAPARGVEFSKISQTYDITMRKYQDLLGKLLESQLSENMEKKQKAEQFQVIDPANFPIKPVRPNRMRILLLGLLGGLATGFGLIFMWESLNTSFKRGDEIEGYTNIPLLATIPAFITRRSVFEQRRAQVILVLASGGTLALGFVAIRFIGPLYFF